MRGRRPTTLKCEASPARGLHRLLSLTSRATRRGRARADPTSIVDAQISSVIATDGPLTAAISNAVVGLLRDFTGRGPTQARTTIGSDTIVVTLRDSLTKAERTLAGRGQSLEVLAMRRAFQDTMRVDLIAAVERLTHRQVEAFLSDNLHEPDVAVEIFLLVPLD
jgi:uncharacterized protein YbcI